MYGASTFSLQRRSIICIAPSSLLNSDTISLPRNTGISLHVGKKKYYIRSNAWLTIEKYKSM